MRNFLLLSLLGSCLLWAIPTPARAQIPEKVALAPLQIKSLRVAPALSPVPLSKTVLAARVQQKALQAIASQYGHLATQPANSKPTLQRFTPSSQTTPTTPVDASDLYALARKQEFLLNTIQAGYVYPHYHMENGREFYPYAQACLRAQWEGDNQMLDWLKKLDGMQKSLLYSKEPLQRLGLQDEPIENSNEIIMRIYWYMKDTVLWMFLGYSWGEMPLGETLIPPIYYSPLFYQHWTHFLQQHPEIKPFFK